MVVAAIVLKRVLKRVHNWGFLMEMHLATLWDPHLACHWDCCWVHHLGMERVHLLVRMMEQN